MRAELNNATCFPWFWTDLQQGSKPSSAHFEPLTTLRRMQLLFRATRGCARARRVLAAHLHSLYSQASLPKWRWTQLLLMGNAMWKATVLHRSAPRTASNAIHAGHCLLIWNHPVFKKMALWLVCKLSSWSFCQWEPHQDGIAFQKAPKFKTACITFKSAPTTWLLAKWRSPRNEQAEQQQWETGIPWGCV